MPEFKDLSCNTGLAVLNDYLADRSYIDGNRATKNDICVFAQVRNNVDGAQFPHVVRWYNHISSIPVKKRARLPGEVKEVKEEVKPKQEEIVDEDGDDFEKKMSFSDDDEDDEAMKLIQERAAAKHAADAAANKKPERTKSTIILDIKPAEEDTDMADLEAKVRALQIEGGKWAGAELVPVFRHVKKLRIICVIWDDMVTWDDINDRLEAMPEISSIDIFAWNKL